MSTSPRTHLTAVFGEATHLITALRRLQAREFTHYTIYSPLGVPELEPFAPRRDSPIRWITLVFGLLGMVLGFFMAIGAALSYGQIVGGKHPVTFLPYSVLGFELTVLIGGVSTFFFVLWLARLGLRRPESGYDPRFNQDKYGLVLHCDPEQTASLRSLLQEAGAEEVYEPPRA